MVTAVYWPQEHDLDAHALQPLAPFPRDDVDEIYVGDAYDNETVLRRNGERWFLPELANLPADSQMVAKLLHALGANAGDWPVANSIAARQRFQVADYHYQRRISLLRENNLLGTFLFGTSPGFRKVHVRNEAQDAIYSVEFNTFDAPGHSGAWLDRKLLQVRTPLRITADSYSLYREGNEWRSGLGLRPEERELEALLSALRSIQVDGIANGDEQRDLAAAEADLVLEVEGLAGTVTLELFSIGDKHFIHGSEYPLFFTLGEYDYERLTTIDLRRISGEQSLANP
jgi:hypothetical protein